jgi:hypothetical protein
VADVHFRLPVWVRQHAPERWGPLVAVVAFIALSSIALSYAPRLVEPDDYAYRGSIVALDQGHVELTTAQYHALAKQLGGPDATGIGQWVQLSNGKWISEKNPGYPFLAVPFEALGIMRLAPLFYALLGCLGLFFGGRRWLGPWGGAFAVGLFCSSGAALFFAWREWMPTFAEASLIAAGTGALLWTLLSTEARPQWRIAFGVLGFLALEAAVSTRYTDVFVLGCAVAVVIIASRMRSVQLPAIALPWWLGSAVLFGIAVAVWNTVVYGGPLSTGYASGIVTFGLDAVWPNLRRLPTHLTTSMPMLVLGLLGLGWILGRAVMFRHAGRPVGDDVRRDLAVGLALAASWFVIWALYAAYTWTADVQHATTLQLVRVYVPALGAMSLLGAWLLVRIPRWSGLAVVIVLFGLGAWSFAAMRDAPPLPVQPGGVVPPGLPPAGGPPPASPSAALSRPRSLGDLVVAISPNRRSRWR